MDLFYVAIVLASVASWTQGVRIGTLPTEQHRVSGEFHIVDKKTLFIEDFNYDGGGPGAFLYYYRPGVAVRSSGGGVIIPLPSSVGQTGGSYPGSFQRRSFNNEDFTVTLPEGTDACDIGTITVWCQPFRAIFSRLAVPTSTFVNNGSDPCTLVGDTTQTPPTIAPPEFDNCLVLHNTLQVSWRVDNSSSSVRFRLCGCSDSTTTQYLGFGLSGSTALTLMFGADATIAWVDENGMAQAQDYYLSNYVQCRGGSGACPDTVDTTTGSSCTNDVTDVSGFVQEGQQCISFTRPFNPADDGTCDKAIDPTNQNQYIVWGIGALGETAFQHHTRATASDDPIHLGRTPVDECSGVNLMCQQCDPFVPDRFIARENTTFTAVIGPSANPRGYTAITGQAGWGIAWYINGTLIPELVVERGRTYTFLISGGDNPGDASNYHPFYITDSVNGGRLLNTDEQRLAESVYAGFEDEQPTGVGPLCEYTETAMSETLRQTCKSYNDYFSSLVFTCNQGEPAKLVWTPDNGTPDLVYYQCASHLNLGWRITVTGSYEPSTTTEPTTLPPTTPESTTTEPTTLPSTTPESTEEPTTTEPTTLPPTTPESTAEPATTEPTTLPPTTPESTAEPATTEPTTLPPTTPESTAEPTTTETTDPTLTPPTDVEGFCSHAIWRIPSGVPCGDIDKFEVKLYNPTTGGEELREASADGTFYSLPSSESDDELFLHEDTQFQVRIVTSSGKGELSEAISLGCTQADRPRPSVYFELKGKEYANNSVIIIETIGEGDDALLCKTNKEECCSDKPNRFGEFYYPDSTKVPINKAREGFYRNRGDQLVRLNRRRGTLSPTGVYKCELPDSNGVMQQIYANLAFTLG